VTPRHAAPGRTGRTPGW